MPKACRRQKRSAFRFGHSHVLVQALKCATRCIFTLNFLLFAFSGLLTGKHFSCFGKLKNPQKST